MSRIAEKLKTPIGPFNVSTIICDRSQTHTDLGLTNVKFQQGGNPIGLDMIEDRDARKNGLVHFKGELIVDDVDLLTETGYRYIYRELEQRLPIVFQAPNFSLSNFLNKNTVRVIIIGTLLFEPLKLDVGGLPKLVARDEELRTDYGFLVLSLHCSTYELSRLYLSRYHIWRTILAISKESHRAEELRTPKWLVSAYIKYNNKLERPLNHTSRPLDRVEIYKTIGPHVTWIKEKIRREGIKPLNSLEWDLFCKKMGRYRNRNIDENDCDEIEEQWSEVESSDDEESIPQEEGRFDISRAENFAHTYREVRDEAGSLEISPADDYEEEEITDPSILEVVPISLMDQAPRFPATSPWECTDPSCSYTINLHNPSTDNLIGLSRNDINFIRSLKWDPGNSRIVTLFNSMVEAHFHDHLKEAGVRLLVFYEGDIDVFGRRRIIKKEITGPGQITEEIEKNMSGIKMEWKQPRNHLPAFHHLHEN